MSEENLLAGVLQAQVRVEDQPASRQIVAVERQTDGSWRVCGNAQSGEDGLAELSILAQPDSSIYALAVDDWGAAWSSGMVVSVGDLVRPSSFVGWLYRVTQAGTLPAEEPVWWNSAAIGPQPAGTAALEAERYYQPIAHGPMSVDFDLVDPGGQYPIFLDVTNTTPSTSSTSTRVVLMPAEVAEGDLLLMHFFNASSRGASTPGGWERLAPGTIGSLGLASDWFYRIADGTESGGTASVSTNGSARGAAQVHRFQAGTFNAASPAVLATATGGGVSATLPGLSAGGVARHLWIAACVSYFDGSVSVWPFSESQVRNEIGALSGSIPRGASCHELLESESSPIGDFVISTAIEDPPWITHVVAVRPYVAGG